MIQVNFSFLVLSLVCNKKQVLSKLHTVFTINQAQQMKIQLQEYFQNTLPKHNFIDTTLSPLLTKVKENKINSIHQLRNKLRNSNNSQQETLPPSFHLTVPVFPKSVDTRLKKQSFSYSQKVATSHKFNLISTIDSHRQTPKSNRQKYRSHLEERIVFINPVSKVKKHLVDNIDFKQIQRVMYHQPNKVNKYQSFFQGLAEKRGEGSPHKVKSASKNIKNVKLLDNDQVLAIEPTINYNPQESIFRITQKRRFWITTRQTSKRKTPNTLLEVTNLGKTVCIE